ncbi:hypothetical protein [Anabaena azotica]|uniref:Uncharacterized protein n=1 Tax=Anabaena azotica FACHB-119 TaxID=947527 RepID=A0ABR8D0X1_9NOST|nr:hypothetical protein [Anabaena azotica]MBD2499836.1 hypothetical protein [Anabaena azotica FACHB-119]
MTNPHIDENALYEKRQQLRQECHQLIERIFYHRNGLKLLEGAASYLRTFAEYKANRNASYRRKPENNNQN